MRVILVAVVGVCAAIRFSTGFRAWVADLCITTGFHMAPGGTMMWPGVEGDQAGDDDDDGDGPDDEEQQRFREMMRGVTVTDGFGPRGQ